MSTFRPRIYVAGKYSAETPEGRLANTRRAIEVGIHLWHKGYAPFIPHLSHYTDEIAACPCSTRITSPGTTAIKRPVISSSTIPKAPALTGSIATPR
jgi:hypothetical protein